MATNTRIPGTIIRSGSIPTTALGGGVISSSVQLANTLPAGTVSSSAQYPGWVTSSAQVVESLPNGTVSSSAQYPGWVTGSNQIDITQTTNYTTFSSSLSTADTTQTSRLSAIENVTGSYATTGSNTLVGIQTISNTTNSTNYLDGAVTVAGGMSVRKDVRVSGSLTVNGLLTAVSMSTQYVTSSQYVVGDNKIILNDDDVTRFGGMSIIDSGSSSPTTASIYWDSLKHKFIYENLSGSAYNSAIFIAGPKNTGSLGDEVGLTSGYIPYATGDDHIDNSVMFQSSSNVGINTINPRHKLQITQAVDGDFPTLGVGKGALFIAGDTNLYGMYFGVNTTTGDGFIQTMRNNTATAYNLILNSAGGNVGIGTTDTAGYKLNVTGGATKVASYLSLGDNGYIRADSTGWLQFQGGTSGSRIMDSSNAAVRVTFLQNGNVGIGVTNPISKLHVQGADAYLATTDDYVANSAGSGLIVARNAATGNTSMSIYAVQSGGTSYSNLIVPGGNFGIGNITPDFPLDVLSNSGANGIKIRGRNNSGIDEGSLSFMKNNGTTTQGYIQSDNTNLNIYAITNLNLGGGNSVDMTILSDGNIGIGTTNPGYKLDVSGSINIRQSYYLHKDFADGVEDFLIRGDATAWHGFIAYRPNTGTSNRGFVFGAWDNVGSRNNWMVIRDGSVGIGTTVPAAPFEIAGAMSNSPQQFITNTDVTVGNKMSGLYLYSRAASNGWYSGIDAYVPAGAPGVDRTDLRFYTTNVTPSERMRITAGGNVGIGTTNPSTAKLTISNVTLSQANAGIDILASGTGTYQRGIRVLNSSMSANDGILVQVGRTDNTRNAAQMVFNYVGDGSTNNYLEFGLFAVDQVLNITGNGRVGVGITNPSQKLHVAGGRVQVDPVSSLNLTSTATTALVTLPPRCPVLVSVHINWNPNGNGVRQVLLYCGAVNLAWGSPASAITILASQDMSFGYVGTPTFTIGGSGDSRTLDISVGNASATGTVDVGVRATVLHLGVEN